MCLWQGLGLNPSHLGLESESHNYFNVASGNTFRKTKKSFVKNVFKFF